MYGLRNSELSTCLFQFSHKMHQTMLLYSYFTPKVDFKRKFKPPPIVSLRMMIDSADDLKISNRTINTNRISNRTYDSKSNRITKLRRSLPSTFFYFWNFAPCAVETIWDFLLNSDKLVFSASVLLKSRLVFYQFVLLNHLIHSVEY